MGKGLGTGELKLVRERRWLERGRHRGACGREILQNLGALGGHPEHAVPCRFLLCLSLKKNNVI